jgi:uncharacterized protein (DUF1697 family)
VAGAASEHQRWVAMLRGINVGTANRISMADLRSVFTDLGFTGVATLLQSGNVIFDASEARAKSAGADVSAALLERFEITSAVLVLSGAQLRAIAEANPLVEVATDDSRLAITFVDGDLPAIELPDDEFLDPEVVRVGKSALYQWSPDGLSKSRLKPAFWKTLGPSATARNWRTVGKILELLESD